MPSTAAAPALGGRGRNRDQSFCANGDPSPETLKPGGERPRQVRLLSLLIRRRRSGHDRLPKRDAAIIGRYLAVQ